MPEPEVINEEELGKSADQIREELREGVTHHHDGPPPERNIDPQVVEGDEGKGDEDGATGHTSASESESEVETKEPGAGEGSSESSSEPGDIEKEENESDQYFTTIDEEEGEESSSGEEAAAAESAPEMDYETLSEKSGYEVHSEDDVVDVIRHLETKDPYEKVSPLLKKAIEFEEKGGDVRQYFQVLGVPTDTLTAKEALRQQFFSANSKLAQGNRELANNRFERDYAAKYSILHENFEDTDFDTTEKYNQWVQDKENAKAELEWEGNEAKETLDSQRDEVLESAPSQAQMSDEEATKIQAKWDSDSSSFVNHFEAIQLPVDKENKTFYNLGLNDQTKPVFQEWAKEPTKFLEYIGFGSDQKSVDAERLLTHMAFAAAFSGTGEFAAGAQFAKHLTERVNKGTLESRLENPKGTKTIPSGQPQKGDVMEAVEALRNDVMRQRRG